MNASTKKLRANEFWKTLLRQRSFAVYNVARFSPRSSAILLWHKDQPFSKVLQHYAFTWRLTSSYHDVQELTTNWNSNRIIWTTRPIKNTMTPNRWPRTLSATYWQLLHDFWVVGMAPLSWLLVTCCFLEAVEMVADNICWEWMLRMVAENACWRCLLRKTARDLCWGWPWGRLLRMAADRGCR